MSSPPNERPKTDPTGVAPTVADGVLRARSAYLVGLGVAVAFCFAAVFCSTWMLGSAANDAALVNAAGRQRMLSQRLARAVLSTATTEPLPLARDHALRAILSEFVEGHQSVRDRCTANGLQRETLTLLRAIEPAYQSLAAIAAELSESAPVEWPTDRPTEVADLADRYLAVMEQIVGTIDRVSSDRLTHAKHVQQGCALAAVVAVLVVVVGVVEPTMRRLGAASRGGATGPPEGMARSLKESVEFNNAILQTAADAILVIDSTGKVLLANPSAHRMFGADAGSLVGRDVTTLMDEYDQKNHHKYIAAYESTGQSSVIGATRDVVGRRLTGERFPVELSVAVMEWDGRRAYTGFLRDVSDRTEMQARLTRSEKLESIGRLAAGVAHEINTPLQFINANTEYLEMATAKLADIAEDAQQRDPRTAEHVMGLAHDMQRAVSDNLEGIRRVGEIVAAMKSFTPGTDRKQPVNLNDCVRATVNVSRGRCKSVADVRVELDPALPTCDGHAAEISQALLNVVDNAVDAIEDAPADQGGLGEIVVRTWESDGAVCVSVADSGPGVPDELLTKVFDQFFTTKEVGRGSGQGLAVAHNVAVTLHGGSITVENRPEGGALFAMTLPIEATSGDTTRALSTNASEEPPTQVVAADREA